MISNKLQKFNKDFTKVDTFIFKIVKKKIRTIGSLLSSLAVSLRDSATRCIDSSEANKKRNSDLHS